MIQRVPAKTGTRFFVPPATPLIAISTQQYITNYLNMGIATENIQRGSAVYYP